MDYFDLRTHLDTDPDVHGYTGMTDAEVVTSLLTETKSRNVLSMSGTDVAQNIDSTDWSGLNDGEKNQVIGICGWSAVNPWGKEADIFLSIFGGGSATIVALNAARVETVSEAEFYGFAGITEGDVNKARALEV